MPGNNVKVRYSFLRIHTGSDLSRRRLPLMIAESENKGPVVWLTACAHGEEVGGMVVIQEIFKNIKNTLKRGSIFAFPLMNPSGFETLSRNIVMSKEDLNRSFPGEENGTLAQRIAAKIFAFIRSTNPTIVLDLHNDWARSIPYTLIDPDPGAEHAKAYEKSRAFAAKTGFVNILETDEFDYSNTLSFSLIRSGIPALSLELGESYVVNEKNISYGTSSIRNILKELDMVDSNDEEFRFPIPETLQGKILKYSDRPFSSTSGIIRFGVKPGEYVAKGRKLARVYNAFGKHLETISALNDALVLGCSDYSVAFPGASVVVFGLEPNSNS